MAKLDKHPNFTIMQAPIRLYDRHETYPYLGHKFNIAGNWDEQVTELCQEYIHRITLIDSAPLPVRMKIEAIRQIAVAKIQHLFHNVHISQQNLLMMNNATVNIVRKWLCLNTRTTRDIIFQPCNTGGLGVPNIEWLYT